METKRGKVITFYSYKGGTGRSMALANVACLLARRSDSSRGILAIDWDLEAPGLHHFFKVAADGVDPAQRDGLIELCEDLRRSIEQASSQDLKEERLGSLVQSADLKRFVSPTTISNVSLLTAGRMDESYSERVVSFNWRLFFQSAPSLFRIFAERLTETYDYVLIDSRTGLNDTSGICTALLPDQLVLVFTPNTQSLSGGIEMLRKALVYRTESVDLRPLTVFPLPSRVDLSEPDLLVRSRFGDQTDPATRVGYQERFERFFAEMYELKSCSLRNYFDEVQIQHVPRYAYGEEIAAVIEKGRGNRLSLSRSYAAFAEILARQDPPWNIKPPTESGAELVADVDSSAVKVQAAKEYLAEDRFKVKLHDLVADEVRNVLAQTSRFAYQGSWSAEEFKKRINSYEASSKDLMLIQALIGFWGGKDHFRLLTLGPKRICGQIKIESGLSVWLGLRWYPALLLLYAGGIAAVAADKYDSLRELMLTPVPDPDEGYKPSPLVLSVGQGSAKLHDGFKNLPGHEKQWLPRSEYLYKLLEPILDDLISLGHDYETMFDRFEMLFALEHLFLKSQVQQYVWGPPGRFAWKVKRGYQPDPLSQILAEAEAEGADWPILQAGFFDSSIEQFKEVVSQYRILVQTSV